MLEDDVWNDRGNYTDLPLKNSRPKRIKPKKFHEMVRFTELMHRECESINRIVDIGCGLGHLGHFLTSTDSKFCNVEIIGVESNHSFCKNGSLLYGKGQGSMRFENMHFQAGCEELRSCILPSKVSCSILA